jgi:uncharacterized protein YjbI with pentapeptide repeats
MRRRLRTLLGRGWPLIAAGALIVHWYGWTQAGHDLATAGRWAGSPLARGWPLLGAGLLLAWFARTRATNAIARLRRTPRAFVIAALGAGALGVLTLAFVAVPAWFVPDNAPDLYSARNDVRTTAVQATAGLVLLLGAYFTWRQLHTAREGQVTERFTRAIDHLGSDQLDVRLGGIYALERIARDSEADRSTIAEVLTAYVRTHSPWPPTKPGQYKEGWPLEQHPDLRTRAPDIQAALTVLARVRFTQFASGAIARLDLQATDLRKADLHHAHLEWANLRGAHLEEANLARAHLERADLVGAHLQRAFLHDAQLKEADLRGAHLEEANLARAHLERADLRDAYMVGAHLEEAVLRDAHLEEAVLDGAYVVGAHLEGADLRNARLERADLARAHLEGAILRGALLLNAYLEEALLINTHLEETSLLNANLERAVLDGAYLDQAELFQADLRGAVLHRAHLEGAILGSTELDGAVASASTRWPNEFDWRAEGVIDADVSVPEADEAMGVAKGSVPSPAGDGQTDTSSAPEERAGEGDGLP